MDGYLRKNTLVLLVLAGVSGGLAWRGFQEPSMLEGFVSSNGCIEATEYDIATKYAARVDAVLVRTGDGVEAGQVLARMDTDSFLLRWPSPAEASV